MSLLPENFFMIFNASNKNFIGLGMFNIDASKDLKFNKNLDTSVIFNLEELNTFVSTQKNNWVILAHNKFCVFDLLHVYPSSSCSNFIFGDFVLKITNYTNLTKQMIDLFLPKTEYDLITADCFRGLSMIDWIKYSNHSRSHVVTTHGGDIVMENTNKYTFLPVIEKNRIKVTLNINKLL